MTRRSVIHAAAAAAAAATCVGATPKLGAPATPLRAAVEAPGQPVLLSSAFIYESAPFPSCHASTVGRTRGTRLFETWSGDNGRTWTPLSSTELPNPNSGTDAVTLGDGRHLLDYNHNDKSKGRTPLNVAVSNDKKTCDAALVLEGEPGEYGCPAVIQPTDGLVHATYTWKWQRMGTP